ncbi:flagellar assembly peptidoglycan hydrolase FlgJ [Glaciecola sp. XM2]|uniref:flagellar assembly peptidoglycan hydrolase FlgJ n=1 Tax=Glaciecola sp. XM2 TaxID=1914931 RepID=UPI001BDE1D7C|nr:flagellar assembly peptidoglycan hydrolase FlgJ [Glaciecola sp. XM2]MBT1450801.1 flagellar assembly peptidoglycan hydrolase FlgJ [Glaciecola sp. XM2]
MDLSANMKSKLEMSRSVHDLGSLDTLREAAKSGDDGALEEAAKQFEAIFVQMLLKSMRKAQDAMADKDSPFNSDQVKFYRDMHDQQLATDLSTKGSIGLADVIVQQMSINKGVMPASAVRSDADLSILNRNAVMMRQNAENIIAPAPSEGAMPATKQAAFESPASFISALYPKAKEAAQRLGIEAKALIAQAAVETGWGKYMIHQGDGNNAHNLFGIKADKRWDGDKAVVDTIEFTNNIPKKQQAAFRSYDSFEASLNDYVDFVSSSPRYQQAIENTAQPHDYFKALQQAGYATDPKYADKIMSVYNSRTMSDLLP